MEHDTDARLQALEAKVDKVYESAEKTRKYILVMSIVSVAVVVVPLIGLAIVVPMVMSTLSSSYAGLL